MRSLWCVCEIRTSAVLPGRNMWWAFKIRGGQALKALQRKNSCVFVCKLSKKHEGLEAGEWQGQLCVLQGLPSSSVETISREDARTMTQKKDASTEAEMQRGGDRWENCTAGEMSRACFKIDCGEGRVGGGEKGESSDGAQVFIMNVFTYWHSVLEDRRCTCHNRVEECLSINLNKYWMKELWNYYVKKKLTNSTFSPVEVCL